MIISKSVFDLKISCISTSFKKEISILSHIAKKLTGPLIFAKLLIAARPGCVNNMVFGRV